jgi:hypothetical protein
MKIGIMRFPTLQPVDVAVVAQQAEALGFDSLWVGEHPIMSVQSTSPFPGAPDGKIPDSYSWFVDPFVALARASAVTTTLKLGTGITPTATLLEHTLLAQGFRGTSKATFPRRLRPQNRDSTWANLVKALK